MTSKSRAARRAEARRPQPSTPRWVLPAVGIGVVLVAALAAVLLTGGGTPGPSAGPSGAAFDTPATVSGGALAPFQPEGSDPVVGQQAPALSGVDFDGEPVSVTADGRPKMLLFLSHSCPHCQREVPVVQEWVDGGRLPSGVDLVAVASNIDPQMPNYPPDAWLEREGWTSPVLSDPTNTAANAFGLTAFPYFVMLDGDGKVVARMVGELPPDALDQVAASLAAG
jgi:thiol-disulfide isomerase/thioredoxin